MLDTVETSELSPDAVIQSAISATERFLMEDALKNPRSFAGADGPAYQSRYDTLLTINSRDHCVTASAFAVNYLQKNSPDFPVLALLNGHSEGTHSQSPFLFNKNLLNHTYALTQDTHGIWRAFSPANHQRNDNSPMRRVFEDQHVQNILKAIEVTDGGSWPSAEYMIKTLQEKYQPPQNRIVTRDNKTELDIFTIDEMKKSSLLHYSLTKKM